MAKKKMSRPADALEGATFEESLSRLEAIVQQLEQGDLTLDESLRLYEEGIARIKHCGEQLAQVERQVELLTGVDAEGQPETQAFDEEAMSLEEKQSSRSRRRSL